MRLSPSTLLLVGLTVIGLALSAGAQPAHALCPEGSFQCTCNGAASCQTSILGCWSSCESASQPAAAASATAASFLAGLSPTAEGPGGCSPEFCDSCALLLKTCQRIRNICFCAS